MNILCYLYISHGANNQELLRLVIISFILVIFIIIYYYHLLFIIISRVILKGEIRSQSVKGNKRLINSFSNQPHETDSSTKNGLK